MRTTQPTATLGCVEHLRRRFRRLLTAGLALAAPRVAPRAPCTARCSPRPAPVLVKAEAAAEAATRATADTADTAQLTPARGRAARMGALGYGHPDAGAVSLALILTAAGETLGRGRPRAGHAERRPGHDEGPRT
ncbi:DAK2 domain-containing protein [Streptomyces inhibens]|uniref:DAK2 domain-containing protein n=1 Tax=Streptomyces inhibens TaxID=2293571 RepID=UPI001EE6B071|nr:DAK2 domain-containing protein [Streptomyces inhibens]UKY52876.1 DAK2 domain-containing protein [Streptomyces inhibens]